MAAMQPLRIPCPACGHTIEVPVTGIFEGIVDNAVQYTAEIDREPIREHAAKHVEAAGGRMPDEAEEYAGRVVVTWPKPTNGLIHGATVAVADADTGEPIVSALDITIRVNLDGPIVAEMTMLTGLDGKPLRQGEPLPPTEDRDGWRMGTFRWLVAEMRTAEVEAR